MEILKINNIKKYYVLNKKNQMILDNINFTFNKGEIISILGESGSGKSTLLNILGGLDENYEGDVFFEGNNIKGDINEYRKKHIGFVFQNFNLIPYLNLIENVEIPLLLTNIKSYNRRKLAIEALIKVGLKEHMYKKTNELSGGEKQRVAIARAIVKNPKILICDEPTGSLDSYNTKEILKIFINLAQRGHTIIIATHSNEVSKISNKVIKINDGRIVNCEIINDYLEFYEEISSITKNKRLSILSTIFISIKNYLQKLKRNVLVSIGTSISLMALLMVISLSKSIKTYINEIVSESNNNIIEIYNEKQTGSNIISKAFTNKQLNDINNIKEVNKIYYGYIEKGIFHINLKEYRYDFDNIKTYSELNNIKFLIEGSFPNEGEIILNYYMYEKLDKKLINNYITFKLDNMEKTLKVVGIYEDGLNERNIYFKYDDIKNMLNIEPNVIFLSSKKINILKDNIIKKGYFLSYVEESIKIFNDTFDVIIYLLAIFSILSLIISFIMIMVILYISVLERTKEIGILRAFGFIKKDIKKIFVLDGFLFGIISGLLCTITSIIILLLIDNYIVKSFNIKISSININYILFVIVISIIVSILSSIYPSKKASKLNVIDALRYE